MIAETNIGWLNDGPPAGREYGSENDNEGSESGGNTYALDFQANQKENNRFDVQMPQVEVDEALPYTDVAKKKEPPN